MNLVLNWNPNYIKSLADRVQEYMKEHVYTDGSGYVNDGEVDLFEQEETESALSNVLADDDLLGIVESDDFPELAYAVFEAIPEDYFDEIKRQFEEELRDAYELATNPMRFHGMSVRDFI